MIQFMFNRLVLFVFFWAVNVSFVYASNLKMLLDETNTQIKFSSPTKVNFFEHQSFKKLVAELPDLKKEVEYALSSKQLSISDYYALGHATQYLGFNDFIYYQALFVSMWTQEKISNDVFSRLFFQSMNTSRRGFYLYQNERFSQVIKHIVINQKNKKIEVIGHDFLSKWSSGQLMRQDVIRVRKNGSASDERIDSENYLGLGFIDALSIKALKNYRHGLLLLMPLLIFMMLSALIKSKRAIIFWSGVWLSGGLGMTYLLFYQGVLIF